MKVTIFGTEYVGLVTGGCLVQKNHEVICFDINVGRIEKLNEGKVH